MKGFLSFKHNIILIVRATFYERVSAVGSLIPRHTRNYQNIDFTSGIWFLGMYGMACTTTSKTVILFVSIYFLSFLLLVDWKFEKNGVFSARVTYLSAIGRSGKHILLEVFT